MAGLFLVFALAILAIFFRQRVLSITLTIAGLVLTVLMLWHHATEVLKINW